MSLPNPAPIAPKTSTQNNEVSIATSISDVNRFFQPKTLKVSKNSPPTANDVNELELTIDKTTGKLHTMIDGVMKSVQFT